jgi:hypothetical protein
VQPLLRMHDDDVGVGGVAWDVEASTPCTGCCDITQSSSCITTTSGARSGADSGRLLNWPYPGGESPSAAAPAALWSLVGRLPKRAYLRPCGEAWGTNAREAAVTASSCCGLAVATRDSSTVVTALAANCGALSERRLVVAGVPDLSALAGVRAGTVGVTLSAKKRKSERLPLEIEGARGETLLTSNWRIPASSSLRAGGSSVTRRRLYGACWHFQ